MARRPLRAQDARDLSQRALRLGRRSGCRRRSWPHRRWHSPTGMRVASPRTSRIDRSRPSAGHLAEPQPEHGAGEVDADDRRAGHSPDGRHREIGGPGAEIQDARTRRQFAAHRRRDRASGDRARRSARGSGGRSAARSRRTSPRCATASCREPAHPFHAGYRSCLKPSALRILPAMKSARSSSVFGIW